jgi:uncharacterized protein YecT (DUF1311 family)
MKLSSILSGALLAALTLTSQGGAQARIDPEKEYSAQYVRCLNAGDAAKGVTPAMVGCINQEYGRQDTRLNAAYQAAMTRLSPKSQEALRGEQRAWIKRRDSGCEENLSGGTIDMIERAECHLSMTAVRAVELERLAKRPVAATAGSAMRGNEERSEARAFPHDAGVVDLLVIGPAARSLYDRLPGRGVSNACGATGLHKGDGRMRCTKVDASYSCHVWLDASKQTLAEPEEDDC